VLPLRGVAQIKYDSTGSASPDLVPINLLPITSLMSTKTTLSIAMVKNT
jgi:hypothetical protein